MIYLSKTKYLLLIKTERCTQKILCSKCPFKLNWSGNHREHNNIKTCFKNKIRIRR
jgi:hypothetical protein